MPSSYLDLSFGAGLAADRADHVATVQPQLVVVDAQDALVPGAHVDVVIATLARIGDALQIHDVIPGREGMKRLSSGKNARTEIGELR